MFEIAGLVVAGVTALGTIVQAYYSSKAANLDISKTKLRKAEERAGFPLKVGVKKVAEVIDDKLLEALQCKIDMHNKKLIRAFQSPEVSDTERERMVEEARIQICSFLLEVKRFNDGKLPTKRLEKLWASNKCKT